MTNEELKAMALDTINRSERDIIGEYVDEIKQTIDDDYTDVQEEHVLQFSDDILKLYPDADEFDQLWNNPVYDVLLDILESAL